MGASTPAQVRALLAKSAVYQRRNTATNICLVLAPIFFCGLLAVLQVLANNLILAQRNNQCGCQCTECCAPTRVQVDWTAEQLQRITAGEKLTPRYRTVTRCAPLETGYCERTRGATCRSYNDSSCSLRFSSPRQAVFCAIPQPSSWPPVMQTPRLSVRAGGSTTQWLPFTGSNMTAARAVAANLVDTPQLPNLQAILDLVRTRPASLLSLRPSQVVALVLPMLAPGGLLQVGGESVDAAQLSRLELKFGSALTSNNDYYLENAFINSNSNTSRLQFILPPGGCSAAGIANVTTYTVLPLQEMLLRYYNASYPLVVAPLLQLFNITADKISGGLDQSQFGGITTACVDTLLRELDNATALDRRLYCGFGVARCDGTYFTREYGGAWNFKDLGPTKLEYDAYYNLSLPVSDWPVNYRIHELLNMATKAWTRTYWGDLPIVYTVRNRLMGLMSFPKYALDLKLDFSVVLGPLFYTWVVQMLMPSLLHQLVYEKEKRLRMMMKMHGLGDGAYWLVTYLWYLMLYVIYIVFFVFFGTVIRLKIFTTSSLSLHAVLYFIFGNNMLAFMFMLSSLFSSSRTATVAAFLYIFASGLIGELLLRTLMQQDQPYILAVQLVPGFALYRGLFEFSEYSLRALFADVPGLRWTDLRDPGNGMIAVWVILLAEWPVFMVLAWYFEQVLNSGTGASRHPLFFIRGLWRKRDADIKELREAQHGYLGARPAAGPAAAPPKGAELEPPVLVEAMPSRSGEGADSAASSATAAASDGAARHRSGAAGPVAEGVDDSVAVVCGGEGDGGGGGGLGDGRGAEQVAPDAETDVTPLPGSPIDRSSGRKPGGSGRGSAQGSISGASRRAARGEGDRVSASGDGGGGGGGGTSLPADALVVSGIPAVSSSRRLFSSDNSQRSRSSRGGSAGGGPAPAEAAAAVAAIATSPRVTAGGSPRGGSPPGGSPRSGAYSPVSIAWAATCPAATLRTSLGAAGSRSDSEDSCSRSAAAAAPAAAAASGSGSGGADTPMAGDARIVIRSAVGDEEGVSEGTGKGAATDGAAAGIWGATAAGDGCGAGSRISSETSGSGGGDAVGLQIQAYDVAAEAERVARMDDELLTSTPIVVRGLAKVFSKDRAGGGGCGCGGCGWCGGGGGGGGGGLLGCCASGQRARVAVRTLTLAIERGECFGLLGPNGAGKTTTINMLTGFLEPSAGDALVEGRSVRTRMPEIYRMMGVCPQDNLLWEQLTGEEHLMFYGRLKGLKGEELTEAVEAGIRSVKLHVNDAGKRRVSAYSGGMKRRLSVAISFIGSPQVVYLDEPSTGLDPASRRALWDVVRSNKDGRAIILTTHSMEEAEILCDRLGIFVDGQLVCVGPPREITARYAGHLVFTLTVGPGHEDAARAFVARVSPNARLTYALGSTFKYELPTTDVSLSGVFSAVAAAKGQMQVLDWGVANATLEEVFIKFARQIGVETRDQ